MQVSETLLPDWLTRCAENAPEHLAIQHAGTRLSFSELDRQVTHLARQIATAGIREGDHIALLAANGLDFVKCVHACTRLGVVLVLLNTRLTPAELDWQLRDAHATLLIHDAANARLAAQTSEMSRAILEVGTLSTLPETPIPLRTLIDLDATQAIMYTSGTTGSPKGVIISYGMQWWNALGSALNLGHRNDDCWLACLPLFHIGGLAILMRSVIYGISVVVQEKFDPDAVNRSLREDGVTIISVVAAMLQRMLADLGDGRYPEALRCVLLGGGPASQTLLEACASREIPVVQTYGLTEACSQAVTLSPEDALRKLGSAGRPLLPVQLRIMQDEQPVAAGTPGMIFLKGPTITPGYFERPAETAQAIQDGWLATGDIGYLDAQSYLYVLDRRNDLIVSGGENIYPAEIEAVLLGHPAVEEAGVCGSPDARWGQVPIAFVRLRAGQIVSADALLGYASQHLARYKMPRAIHFIAQMPRNAAGKLVRRELPRLLS